GRRQPSTPFLLSRARPSPPRRGSEIPRGPPARGPARDAIGTDRFRPGVPAFGRRDAQPRAGSENRPRKNDLFARPPLRARRGHAGKLRANLPHSGNLSRGFSGSKIFLAKNLGTPFPRSQGL